MRSMTRDEAMAFLAEGTRTGKLATIRKDGSPNVAPIWFVVDGDSLVFNAEPTREGAFTMSADLAAGDLQAMDLRAD